VPLPQPRLTSSTGTSAAGAITSLFIPQPITRRATVHFKTKLGSFGIELGGIWGGQPFKFFNAIFNIADMAISTGVGILIVFNKKAFAKKTAIENYKES
jgi:lipoprotein signal peptidase